MENEKLILSSSDKKHNYVFENKFYIVDNKNLVNDLRKTNIKNRNSSLVISSLNDLHISDVVQIKINISGVGYLLANFTKEVLVEEKRSELLEEIKQLKTENDYIKKIQSLISVLNNYKPLYVSFINSEESKVTSEDFKDIGFLFPFLYLIDTKKRLVLNFDFLKNIHFKKIGKKEKWAEEPKEEQSTEENPNTQKPKVVKEKETYPPIAVFEFEYFFIFIFSLLGAFGITSAIFEIMNKESIAIFLSILGLAFAVVLVISMQSTIYNNGKERNPLLRYYLVVFIIVGIVAGIIIGYFVSKGVLKTEQDNFNYRKMILLSSLISVAALLSSVGTSILANKIALKIKQNKKPH